jgi:PAT family beta-lactamase induction signal transducer AmpG
MAAFRLYMRRPVLSMLFLGFSSGLPFMLIFQTLSAWLSQSGIKRAAISMLSWVGIMYSIKFLWAPIVDRVDLPLLYRFLGRRRSWMLVAQLGVALGLTNLAASDPRANIWHVALSALFVALCAAVQDISIDAWRIESAPQSLQGVMAAAYQLGYRVAIVVASAGALTIAADSGWSASYQTMALLVLIGVTTTLVVKEPKCHAPVEALAREQHIVEWLPGRLHFPERVRLIGGGLVGAVVLPLVDFFARFGFPLGALILGFIGTYRLTDFAMGVMTNPFYLEMGFTLKEIALTAKVFGVVFSILGVLIGGVVLAKFGRARALLLGSVMIMCSNVCYSLFATVGQHYLPGLAAIVGLDNIAVGVHGTALIAFMSSLTSTKYTATQYALLSSMYALPGKLLMGASGFVVDAINYPTFFLYTTALSLPALLLLFMLIHRNDERLRI